MLLTFARKIVAPTLSQCRREMATALFLLGATNASAIATIEVTRSILQAAKMEAGGGPRDGLLAILPAETSTGLLVWCSILAVVLPTLTWVGIYFRDDAFERVALSVIRSLRDSLFARLLRMPYLRLMEQDPGVLVKRVVEDTVQVRALVIEAGLRRLSDVILVIGIFAYLCSLSLAFAALSAATICVFFAVAYWSAGLAKGRMRERDASRDALSASATETFSRLADIRGLAKEEWESRRFAELSARNETITAKCVRWLLLDRSLTGYLHALGPMVVLLIGAWSVLAKGISIEDLVVIIAGTSLLFGPVNQLSAVPITLRQVEVAAENLMRLFDEPSESDGRKSGGGTLVSRESPILCIRDVSYSYGAGEQTLKVGALDIRTGMRVALVGASGVGKSTLMRVIFGMLPDYAGTIEVDGRDMRALSLDELRLRIGYLPQDNGLFSGTIRTNIAYGAEDPAHVDDDQIRAALALAGFLADVERMPEGLDTRLEVVGQNLSTGQRRRLCIARALMRRPEVLLLDEPLVGVSPSERKAISSALLSLGPNVAVIMATHDHEMLDEVDLVVLLRRQEEGAIVRAEIGTLSELLARAPGDLATILNEIEAPARSESVSREGYVPSNS